MASQKESLDIDSVIQQIKQSNKYRALDICEDTIRDLIISEFKQHKNKNTAIKAAKKRLHRIVGTYLGDPNYSLALKELESAFNSYKIDLIKDSCTHIMAEHISTEERLSILDSFYSRIFDVTKTPTAILDIACGLNPLSFPWMGLPTSTRYHAYDIHRTRVNFLNQYFSLQGLPPFAKVQDILVHFPQEEADIAFIFKEVHRFEQRQHGCTLPLLDALRVCYLVISLPTRNQTGKWDLKDRHRQLLHSIIEQRPWHITEIEFENELVFCVSKCSGDN